jgi:hypothetical protein
MKRTTTVSLLALSLHTSQITKYEQMRGFGKGAPTRQHAE